MNRFKLSICMIVRDEEKFLNDCLSSLKLLIDSGLSELIIVDTGSLDKTVEIAKRYTKKVYFKEWNNNFSEARNYSISKATGEYIFIMDADQDMEESEVNKLIELFSSEDYKNYNTYSLIYKNFTDEARLLYNIFSLNLIFKNDGTFKYEGKVHNQPIYKGPVKNLDIYMNHYGYIMTEDIKEKKFNRTATLLKKELKKNPNNLYYLYQLSRSYEMHGDNKEAVVEVKKYLYLIEKTKNINYKNVIIYYHNAAIIFFNNKDFSNCKVYCRKMLEIDSELIDAYYLLGECYLNEGSIEEAVNSMKYYLSYLEIFKYEKYSSENRLEIFSLSYKKNILINLLHLKLKFQQYEGLDKYLINLYEDKNKILIRLNELIISSVTTGDINLINRLIDIAKEEKEKETVLYLLSKIIFKYNYENSENIINLIGSLNNSEKDILRNKLLLEEKNEVLNLFSFIDDKKNLNKPIKLEYLVKSLIKIMMEIDKEIITENDKLDEILVILQYLLTKADMLINRYDMEKSDMLYLFNKYINLTKEKKEKEYNKEKRFIDSIEEAYHYIDKKEYIKAIKHLLIALKEDNKFVDIIELIKEDIILEEDINNYNLVSKNEINKIKENLVLLINNNMFEDANNLLNELEKLTNIELDAELISIKATLKIYLDKIDEAETILIKGIKVHRNNFDLLYNLAYVYEKKNKKLSAINIYYDILNIDLNNEIKKDVFKNILELKKKIEII